MFSVVLVRHLLRKENEATASHGSSFELRTVKVEVAVLGSPSLIVLWSVDAKLPHAFHKNKDLWTASFFFHGPDTVELVTV